MFKKGEDSEEDEKPKKRLSGELGNVQNRRNVKDSPKR